MESPILSSSLLHSKISDVYLPEVDSDVTILLLIGRDMMEAHHVIEQRIG
jgi:hypothetical protein